MTTPKRQILSFVFTVLCLMIKLHGKQLQEVAVRGKLENPPPQVQF